MLGMPSVGNDSLLQPGQPKLMRNLSRMRLDSEQRFKIASFQFKGVFRLQFPLPTKSIHHANGTQNGKKPAKQSAVRVSIISGGEGGIRTRVRVLP